jgi:hypothetical protein
MSLAEGLKAEKNTWGTAQGLTLRELAKGAASDKLYWVREATVWSIVASRASGTSNIFARPAARIPDGAVPHIVSFTTLQRVGCGGMSVANVFALRSMAQTP